MHREAAPTIYGPFKETNIQPPTASSISGHRKGTMNTELIEAELSNIIYGYRKAQLLHVAAKLGISDLLANGPKECGVLATLLDADHDALYRVLRALSVMGIYAEDGDGKFRLTEKGELLRKEGPGPVWIDAVMRMEEYNWKPWGELIYSVKTGKSAFEKVFGCNLFEYLSSNPDASRTFNKAMSVYTRHDVERVLDGYDFSGYRTVADLGGGNGELISRILLRYPRLRGVLFDLPEVIGRTDLGALEPDVRKRLNVMEGSFFDGVPPGCDLYILRKIIHDWDDERSLEILTNCRKAAGKKGMILLIESVIDRDYRESEGAVINDIHMLVQTAGGRERTREEYFRLLKSAGFEPGKGTSFYIEGEVR
jgi:hypothetical protein